MLKHDGYRRRVEASPASARWRSDWREAVEQAGASAWLTQFQSWRGPREAVGIHARCLNCAPIAKPAALTIAQWAPTMTPGAAEAQAAFVAERVSAKVSD